MGSLSDIVDKWVWEIVGIALSVAVGWWIINMFLPLNEIIAKVWHNLTHRKPKKVIIVKQVVVDPNKRYCENCGTELSLKAKFCPRCGGAAK